MASYINIGGHALSNLPLGGTFPCLQVWMCVFVSVCVCECLCLCVYVSCLHVWRQTSCLEQVPDNRRSLWSNLRGIRGHVVIPITPSYTMMSSLPYFRRSVFVCLCVSVAVYVCLCLGGSVTLCVCMCHLVSLCVYLCQCLALCVCLCMCGWLFLWECDCIVCLCMCVIVGLCFVL